MPYLTLAALLGVILAALIVLDPVALVFWLTPLQSMGLLLTAVIR
jgi:hypothetical protein